MEKVENISYDGLYNHHNIYRCQECKTRYYEYRRVTLGIVQNVYKESRRHICRDCYYKKYRKKAPQYVGRKLNKRDLQNLAKEYKIQGVTVTHVNDRQG